MRPPSPNQFSQITTVKPDARKFIATPDISWLPRKVIEAMPCNSARNTDPAIPPRRPIHTLPENAATDADRKADAEAAKAAPTKKSKGGAKKKKTVSRTFGDSLTELMTKLRATEHHYIRCLKPNQTLKAHDWDNEFMFRQLAYSGTLEVTEIRKAGLNVRRPLKHFFQYYKMCADDPSALKAGTVTKRTELLLKQLNINTNQARSRLFCAADRSVQYEPGIGGCLTP